MSHILLSRATRRPYSEVPQMPQNAVYDPIAGCWMIDGEPLVRSTSHGKTQETKKCDHETGEDQKGE
jgi:hypothetical protein